eukprot:jgi/Tetstr1/427416/TSEL_017580.t1
MYDSAGRGGISAASSTADTASLTTLVQRIDAAATRRAGLPHLFHSTTTSAETYIPAAPADGLEGDEEDDPPPGFPTESPGHAAFIDPRDWIEYLPRAYAESMLTVGLTTPGLWTPRNDEWDSYLTDEKNHLTHDEYRHLTCYGVVTSSAHAALTDVVATLRASNATARDTADANDLLDSAIRTIATCGQTVEGRLIYLRRFKYKNVLAGEERVAERLVYSRVFDTTAKERALAMAYVDGILNALDDRRLEISLHQGAKAHIAAQFKGGCGRGGGTGGDTRIKEQERVEQAYRASTKERVDKNKNDDKIKGKH